MPRIAIKPGWYLLLLLLAYASFSTVAWQRSERSLRSFRALPSRVSAPSVAVEARNIDEFDAATSAAVPLTTGAARLDQADPFWTPIPGASLPNDSRYLPGALLPGRRDLRQGFEFHGAEAGVPLSYGTPVIAAADGVLVRADQDYQELSETTWQGLQLELSRREATSDERDWLRGRQLWLRTGDGQVLRYSHLSAVETGLARGQEVYRGQVIGYLGNSGTADGVTGTTRGARLGFEIWQAERFFGQNMTPAEILAEAALLFRGP